MLVPKIMISLTLLSSLGSIPFNNQNSVPAPKVIKSIYTNIPEKNNWVIVPKGTKEITISVEAENTETVLFWLIPTGTQTWHERRLLGYSINKDVKNQFNKNHVFSLTWKIDEPSLLDHLVVELIGMEEVTNGGSINISME
ncbi:hypothetical protein [Bacillus sp. FJAT-29937]|uniref:hypothetical protein n=1 Tax=Bacillus sp. FJAT-29937 TaxID=1720553 RepID=UPI000AB6003B|nr:hypothetical protein [Bacillus sp. FJAT-29937]